MAEDPFDLIKIMTLLFLASLVAMSMPDVEASTCRSTAVKRQFDKEQGYPRGRPSINNEEKWIVDHWCPLKCGGLDITSNMVYQQYSESKAKDKWETTFSGCKKLCNNKNSSTIRTVFNCK